MPGSSEPPQAPPPPTLFLASRPLNEPEVVKRSERLVDLEDETIGPVVDEQLARDDGAGDGEEGAGGEGAVEGSRETALQAGSVSHDTQGRGGSGARRVVVGKGEGGDHDAEGSRASNKCNLRVINARRHNGRWREEGKRERVCIFSSFRSLAIFHYSQSSCGWLGAPRGHSQQGVRALKTTQGCAKEREDHKRSHHDSSGRMTRLSASLPSRPQQGRDRPAGGCPVVTPRQEGGGWACRCAARLQEVAHHRRRGQAIRAGRRRGRRGDGGG